MLTVYGARFISVSPLMKPLATTAGASRIAATAADAFPACNALSNATAL